MSWQKSLYLASLFFFIIALTAALFGWGMVPSDAAPAARTVFTVSLAAAVVCFISAPGFPGAGK